MLILFIFMQKKNIFLDFREYKNSQILTILAMHCQSKHFKKKCSKKQDKAISIRHGYDIYFEGATLKFNSSSGQSPQLLTSDGRIKKPKLSQVDGFVGELKEVTEAISKNRNSKDLNAISARNSLDICLKEIRSVYQCRRVSI